MSPYIPGYTQYTVPNDDDQDENETIDPDDDGSEDDYPGVPVKGIRRLQDPKLRHRRLSGKKHQPRW